MRIFFTLLMTVLGLASVASCGVSVQQACDDYATAWCSRQYACVTGQALIDLQMTYGPTPQACAVTYANQLNLNCVGAQSTCAAGTSYDTGAAETCVSDYANPVKNTCALITANQPPATCAANLICH